MRLPDRRVNARSELRDGRVQAWFVLAPEPVSRTSRAWRGAVRTASLATEMDARDSPIRDARPYAEHRSPRAGGAAGRPLERDWGGHFYPVLLGLCALFTTGETAGAIALGEPALGASAGLTALFFVCVLVAVHQNRAGYPVRARVTVAVSVTVAGALAAYLIPGVGSETALLPILSVALVLSNVHRDRIVPLIVTAVGSATVILVLGEIAHPLPAIAGLLGTIYQDAILIAVVVIVLAGFAEFALDARNSLSDLHDSARRQALASDERLAVVASLRTLHPQSTPEATATLMTAALGNLPGVDAAVILEVDHDGLTVLAAASHAAFPFQRGHRLSSGRASYMLERSAAGPWAELWADRRVPGLEDAELVRFGVKGQAFAPIVVGEETVGVVGIVSTDDEQARYLVAELPAVTEFASVAGSILGPALLARRPLLAITERIAGMIASGGFHPVFQPIVDLETNQTVGFEALTRFTVGDPPDRVFADAARVGLGGELEAATLVSALRDAARLPPGPWLSLNVSPALMAEYGVLAGLLAHYPRPIVLEITEHDLIDDYAPLHATMRRLGPNVRLAVDDAGAGVANFRHLVDLRPDFVKIDAGLIRGANADFSRQALIVGLAHFAVTAGAHVVAEGIETSAERETVQRLGVTLGQGFLLARPAPVDEWVRLDGESDHQPMTRKVIPMQKRAAAR